MQLTRSLALATAAAVLLVACGDDDTDTDAGATPAGEETAADAPEAIVSLSPTATEMLYAVGAGDQVVAVDDQSDFPEGVPVTDLSGYEPNVEAIAGYQPDLVVASELPEDVTAAEMLSTSTSSASSPAVTSSGRSLATTRSGS